jgi:hypothetical protein
MHGASRLGLPAPNAIRTVPGAKWQSMNCSVPRNMHHFCVDGTKSDRSFTVMNSFNVSRPVSATHSRWPMSRCGRTLARGLALPVLLACGSIGDGGVTVKGDIEGLDTLAFRGDSLLAQADRAPMVLDSLRLAAQAEFEQALKDSLSGGSRVATGAGDGTLAAPGANERDATGALTAGTIMSKRAQARGDSMARAFAAKMTGGGAGADRAHGDTVRGQLIWQGTEPARSVVLRTAKSTIALSGMATTGMSKLVGSEIVVRGVRITPRDVVVSDFFVRAADGVPAYDGTILPDGGLKLTDGSGTKRVPLPSAMQGLTGARVWVAVKDGRPFAYGLIANR